MSAFTADSIEPSETAEEYQAERTSPGWRILQALNNHDATRPVVTFVLPVSTEED